MYIIIIIIIIMISIIIIIINNNYYYASVERNRSLGVFRAANKRSKIATVCGSGAPVPHYPKYKRLFTKL